MIQNKTYDIFLEILLKRFPDKRSLAIRLSEVLHIEKEAVYRRLRKIVPFSFSEITTISLLFDISLDNILLLGNENCKTLPVRLTMVNYYNPMEEDYFLLEKFTDDIKGVSHYPDSEFISITNTIPQIFYINYEHLYHFYLFKWQYEEGTSHTKIPYNEIRTPERLQKINKEYLKHCMNAHNNILIWDKNILRMLEEDIRYFYDIHLISKEEVKEIRKDLEDLLNEIEKMTINGLFPTGKKIQFYVSNISIKGNYTLMSFNPNYKLSMIKWFTVNDTIAMDETTYAKMKNWMSALQRTSILISESGEIQRIHFFQEQRQILSLLKDL